MGTKVFACRIGNKFGQDVEDYIATGSKIMAIKKKRKSKTNHSKKILSRKIKPKKSIKPHEIITFKYNR